MKKIVFAFLLLFISCQVNGRELGEWKWTAVPWSAQPNSVYSHCVSHWALAQIRYDRMSDLNKTEWQKVRSTIIWHTVFSVSKECWDGLVPCDWFYKQGMGDLAWLGGDGFDGYDVLANITGLGSWLIWHYRKNIWDWMWYYEH